MTIDTATVVIVVILRKINGIAIAAIEMWHNYLNVVENNRY